MTADEIWQAALGELQLEMTRATFETWVKPTCLVSYQDGEMVIATPNRYAQEWLSKRLCSTVNRILSGITGRSMHTTFVVWSAPAEVVGEGVMVLPSNLTILYALFPSQPDLVSMLSGQPVSEPRSTCP